MELWARRLKRLRLRRTEERTHAQKAGSNQPHATRGGMGANSYTAVVSVFFKSTKQNELIPWHAYQLIFKQLALMQTITNTRGGHTEHCGWGYAFSVNWRWTYDNGRPGGWQEWGWWFWYTTIVPGSHPSAPRTGKPHDAIEKPNRKKAGQQALNPYKARSNNMTCRCVLWCKNIPGTNQGQSFSPFGLYCTLQKRVKNEAITHLSA